MEGDGTAELFVESLRLDYVGVDDALGEARSALDAGAGGFILYGGRAGEVRELVGELREIAARPLWIASDLERGAGQQFEGATPLPPPAALAAHPEPVEAARRAADLTAREAREIGINWVLAPVLDLDVERENPIVGTRSFGADPERAARLGRAWIDACQARGVAACAKHFPGHGRTTEDSHLASPAVAASREELEEDLLPFRRAAGTVASVMTAHVGYPALGAEGPATLEPRILRTLLREEMGFQGVVVSDALVMEGVGEGTGGAAEGWIAVRALRAGCDLLLYPSDLGLAVRTVRQAAGNDPELAAIVEGARERSAAVLRRVAGAAEGDAGRGRGSGGPQASERPAGDGAAGPREPLPAFRPDSAELVGFAEECVRGRGTPPEDLLTRGRPVRLHVLSDDDEEGPPGYGEVFRNFLRERGWTVGVAERRRPPTGEAGPEGDPGAAGASGAGEATGADDTGRGAAGEVQELVLLEATPRAWKGRASLSPETTRRIREIVGEGEPGRYLVHFGHPRIVEELGLPAACAWSTESCMERGAAAWLDGRLGAPGAGR